MGKTVISAAKRDVLRVRKNSARLVTIARKQDRANIVKFGNRGSL